jgi:hypothetical protein
MTLPARLCPSTLLALTVLALPAPVWARARSVPRVCPADVQAAVDAACPCDGRLLPDGSTTPWKSHGQYVSCANHARGALRRAGCVPDSDRQTMARCAAHSNCGRPTVVVCCLTDTGTCTDPEPGDGVAGGSCSNDMSRGCDSDDDCTTTHAKLMRNEDACYAIDGDAVDGSVCTACDY